MAFYVIIVAMKKKLLFICNAHAGRQFIQTNMYAVLNSFEENGYETTIRLTQKSKDPTEIIEEMPEGLYDLVVCCGGDGTLDEVVNGMMRRDMQIPIGYIPAGSTNDFGRTLHIPMNIKRAAVKAVSGEPFNCDVGMLNDEYFVYVAAFGIMSAVTYETDQKYKNILGYLAYVLSGIKEISSITSYNMKVTTDNESVEGEYLFGMVTNSESVGGFKSITGKNVKLDDGLFEVTLIRMPKLFIELQAIIASLLSGRMDNRYIYSTKTREITLSCNKLVPWNIDGENGGKAKVAHIRNLQKAITFMRDDK